ncbi:hypothetical protein RV12_GL001182 [Enterococcus quebecensis]|uniref:Uncharacterized protein n=1 Tax=Enterococcus quebecensis TaxID=903983 RepID=A0A1E5GWH7_9ENTE|nr:hypothetical protein BCR23_03090 [Enterococcus quebecensis]OJG75379.1 hypothetical protein RV12_GL001182 [Enterococcus quebecensis]
MYLLLIVLGIIISIHSILLVFVIKKNTEITNKLDQIGKRKLSSKTNVGHAISRNMKKRDK